LENILLIAYRYKLNIIRWNNICQKTGQIGKEKQTI